MNFSIAVLIVCFSANVLLIAYSGAYAWDDGAITLAYGKSLATASRFSLTAVSEIVEGSSSIILVLLSAFAVKIFDLGFYGLITWSKINAFAFLIITVCALYYYLQGSVKSRRLALLVSLATGLFPMFSAEVLNGMEMTILSALVVFLVIFYERRSSLVFAILPLMLATRFESIFYILMAFSIVWLADKSRRREAGWVIVFSVFAFVAMSAVRYWYFGDFFQTRFTQKSTRRTRRKVSTQGW